jgi:hypothetical protein
MKKRIFISHIHEEHALGAVVAEWVTDAFAGHPVQPFLSSDDKSIAAGEKWMDVVEHELDGTAVMISLVSPASLARPWVNIELGAAWIKQIPIIPLCHSGLSPANLPRPFSDFQSIGLDQDNAATRLIEGVARHLGIPHSKRLHFAEFLKEMRDAAGQSRPVPVIAAPVATATRPKEQIAILQALATAENSGQEEVPEDAAAGLSGLSPTLFKAHSAKLKDEGLIYPSYWGGGTHWRNTPDGANWLIDNDLLP